MRGNVIIENHYDLPTLLLVASVGKWFDHNCKLLVDENLMAVL